MEETKSLKRNFFGYEDLPIFEISRLASIEYIQMDSILKLVLHSQTSQRSGPERVLDPCMHILVEANPLFAFL